MRNPPPHRRKRSPWDRAQLAPQVLRPGPSPLAADMAERHDAQCESEVVVEAAAHTPCGCADRSAEWAVDHPGIGVLAYDSEEEARAAAGTAGTLLHWGEEVPS
jgi:hypothetical protein